MKIIVGGMPGAGKSTIAKFIAEKLGYKYISAGQIQRETAKKHGFAEKGAKFIEWHEYVDEHPEIDKEIDETVKKLAEKGACVIDSWLAGYLQEADIKILLKVDIGDSVIRIAKREGETSREILDETLKRIQNNKKRWKEVYGIDIFDYIPFDFVINTSFYNEEQMKRLISLMFDMLSENR